MPHHVNAFDCERVEEGNHVGSERFLVITGTGSVAFPEPAKIRYDHAETTSNYRHYAAPYRPRLEHAVDQKHGLALTTLNDIVLETVRIELSSSERFPKYA